MYVVCVFFIQSNEYINSNLPLLKPIVYTHKYILVYSPNKNIQAFTLILKCSKLCNYIKLHYYGLFIIEMFFFLLFFDTASELETPVAESLPQGKESYTPR